MMTGAAVTIRRQSRPCSREPLRSAVLLTAFASQHLRVHEVGEAFAEVTEGNPWPIGYVWERLRYDWSQPGSVRGVVTDSNTFKPGSTWELWATRANGGSRVEVIGVRHLRGSRAGCSRRRFLWGLLATSPGNSRRGCSVPSGVAGMIRL